MSPTVVVEKAPSPPRRTRAAVAFLSLFALFTLFVSQSIYAMLTANPDFLAIRLAGKTQLLRLVVAFNLLPVLVLFLAWAVLDHFRPAWGRALLGATWFLLLLGLGFQAHNTWTGSAWQELQNSYMAWIIPAALLAALPLRYPVAFRSFVYVLAPVAIALPILFVVRNWVVAPGREAHAVSPSGLAVAREASPAKPPIFLLVFDELTVYALLDADGELDSRLYPNFHALVQQAHWFRNATSNASYTKQSIPSLLSGVYPRPGPPRVETYPHNLGVLLEPNYEVYVYEAWAGFCLTERFHCMETIVLSAGSDRQLALDILFLYLTRIVPRGANVPLPDVRRNWGFFLDSEGVTQLILLHFQKFLQAVEAAAAGPAPPFFFLHNHVPHSPYRFTPDGRIQEPAATASFDPSQRGRAGVLHAVWQKYRTQVQYADTQLGQFLHLLRERGLYDPSLIIVTADHGVSADLRAPGRELAEVDGELVNADFILGVPLLLKLPGQRQPVQSDADAQLIDLLPTVAAVAGVNPPAQIDGRDLFSKAAPQPRLKVAYNKKLERYEFPPDLILAKRKARLEDLHSGETPAEVSRRE